MTKFQPTKISSIKKIWEEEGFCLKKRLSQNFLIDQNIVDKILDAAQIAPGDIILEIGPGSGALTASMLKKGAIVYAIEIDSSAASILKKYLGEDKNFTLINEDILKADLSFVKPGTKIVSNLPYHITSPIIAMIATSIHLFSSITLMVQKEMAARILAKPPSSNRSSFSIFTSYFFKKKSLFIVKPGSFTPKPKVDSVIISLIPKKKLPPSQSRRFFLFCKKNILSEKKNDHICIKR